MSKIVLPPVTGADNLSTLNSNFSKIEEALNDKALYRDNPVGEPNQMVSELDMNGKRIYNLPVPVAENEPARFKEIKDVQVAINQGHLDAQRAKDEADRAKYEADRATAIVGSSDASNLKVFSTKADADLAAALLPDGADAEVSQDETRAGARTRYKVQTGALVFVVNLDQTKLDLAAAPGASLVGYLPDGVGAVATNVQSKLREFVSVKDFGAVGDGVTDDTSAIQSAINSGARHIYFPSGRYKVTDTINLCNLAVTGVPVHLYGDATHYDNGVLTAGSVILSNPGATKWVAEIIGSQFVTMEDLMFVSTGANSAKGGLIYARSTLANFAQNNSLRRVIIKIATAGGTVALANNCAEQFVCDECWLEADIPYITTLGNEQGWTAANATIANTTFSNTAQSFRLTTFTPLTSTAMVLTGLGTANFDNCVAIPKAGNTYAYGVTLRSSLQGYQDCQNITFTGQIESWVNAVRLEGNTRDVKFDFSTSNVTGAHILAVAGTTHYSPKIATNPFNTTGVNVLGAAGATATVYGGNIVIAPNLKLVDANLKLLGTDVDGGNGNMNSAAFFAVAADSSYHARWSRSRVTGSTAWNPGLIATGASGATVFAVTGVAIGDRVDVFWPYTNLGCVALASVESAGNVRITIINLSGFNQTFAAGTWKVSVERPSF